MKIILLHSLHLFASDLLLSVAISPKQPSSRSDGFPVRAVAGFQFFRRILPWSAEC